MARLRSALVLRRSRLGHAPPFFPWLSCRESETQTDPWTPDYVVRPGSAPEVLTLATLSHGTPQAASRVTAPLAAALPRSRFPVSTLTPHCPPPSAPCHRDSGHGLPAGLAEVEMIERARARRAWEANLPPADDPYRALERAKALEEQEMLEWKYREEEIQRVQEERLLMLKQLVADLQEQKQTEQE